MESNQDLYSFPFNSQPSNSLPSQSQVVSGSNIDEEKTAQKCSRCQKSFPTSQQLLQHSLVHNNLRKYPCQYCDKSFKQLSHVQQHLRIHTGERPYKCVIENCTKAFRQLSSLQQHLKGHNLSKPYPDSHFSDTRFSKSSLMLPRPNNLTCQICEKACSNEQRYFQHIHKFHPDYWKVLSSGTPLSDFLNYTPSSSKDSPFLCSICNKRYIHRTGYIKHMSTHADKNRNVSSEGGEVSCSVCKKVFVKESYLLRHLEMKSDSEHVECFNEFKKNSIQKQLQKPPWCGTQHPFHMMCLPSTSTNDTNQVTSFSHLNDKDYYNKQSTTPSYLPSILQSTIPNPLTPFNISQETFRCPSFTSHHTDFTNPYKSNNYYQDSFLNIRSDVSSSSLLDRTPTYFDHYSYFPPKPLNPTFSDDSFQASTTFPILPSNNFLDSYPPKSPPLSSAFQHLSRFPSFR